MYLIAYIMSYIFYLHTNLGLSSSSLDDSILYGYLFLVAFLLLIDWVAKNVGRARKGRESLTNDDIRNFGNYTFNFRDQDAIFNTHDKISKVSLTTKIVLVAMSVVLVITPLYEFIGTLEPQANYFEFSCFRTL